jgi:hypothetical protein
MIIWKKGGVGYSSNVGGRSWSMMAKVCETLELGTSWTNQQGASTHSWEGKLSRQAQKEGGLRWRWKDHGRGKKGSSDGSKEAFHKKRSVPST